VIACKFDLGYLGLERLNLSSSVIEAGFTTNSLNSRLGDILKPPNIQDVMNLIESLRVTTGLKSEERRT